MPHETMPGGGVFVKALLGFCRVMLCLSLKVFARIELVNSEMFEVFTTQNPVEPRKKKKLLLSIILAV